MSDANGVVESIARNTQAENATRHEANGTPPPNAPAVVFTPPDMHRHITGTGQAAGTQNWYLYALATIVVVGFFVLTILMITPHGPDIKIPTEHRDIAFMLFGGLVSGLSMVLSYFFGSSAGSAQKSAELATLARATPQPSGNL